jgi:peptidoglycan hydrolase CwlO-like protein
MARNKTVEARLSALTRQSDQAIDVFRAAAKNLEAASENLTVVRVEASAEAQRQAELAEQARVAAEQAYQRATAVRSLIGE